MDDLTKLEVARRQLGTALWLFLEDLDPVSVHILAGAGAELADGLAREVKQSAFVDHVVQTNPNMTVAKYYGLARQYYNALKHLTKRDGGQRDDAELLASFSDVQNDAHLFIAWSDLTAASPSSPIEAQVFQAWFYACYPEKLASKDAAERFRAVFPEMDQLTREGRKAALREQIVRARADARVMADPRTDLRALVAAASGW